MTFSDPLALELPPGCFVPAGLPLPAVDPHAPVPADREGAVGHVLAAAALARARMAWGRAETYAREAAALAPRAGLPALAAAALNEIAAARLAQGQTTGIEELCSRASALARGGPETARAEINRAVAAGLGQRPGEALEILEGAARIVAGADRWGRQLHRLNHAAALLLDGRLSAAELAASDALRAARREKEEHWQALAGLVGACVHRARGARNLARARLQEAVRAFTRAGDRPRAVQCHYLLGEIAFEAEDPIRAGSHYRDGLAIAREHGAAEAVELLTLRFEHR